MAAEKAKSVTIFVPAGYPTAFSKPQDLRNRIVIPSKNNGDWIPKAPQGISSAPFSEQEVPRVVETKNDSSSNARHSHSMMLRLELETASNSSSSSTSSAYPGSSVTNVTTTSTMASRLRRSLEKAKELSDDAKQSVQKQSKPETNKAPERIITATVCSPNDKAIQTVWHIDVDSPEADKCNIIEPNDRIIIPQIYKEKQEKIDFVDAKVPELDSTMLRKIPRASESVKSEPQQPELENLRFAPAVDSDDWASDDEGFSQLDVKNGCGCIDCDKWLDCPEWRKRNAYFEPDEKKRIKNLKPYLKPADSKPTVIDVEKKVLKGMLIHGANTMKPVESLRDVPFNNSVKEAMKGLNYTEPKPIQKFLWPVILRRIGVCYVGNAGTGKTLAYLPAVCTFAMERDDNYQQFSTYPGPLILILAENKKSCCHIQNTARSLLTCTANSPVVEILSDSSEPNQQNVDVLIATPDALREALIAESVSLKRVVHLIIDDGEAVLKNFDEDATKILNLLNEILVHRPRNKLIHTVISSKHWSCKLETLVKKLYSTPIVYIANQYEAALYGNIQFIKKNLKQPNFKKFYLIDTLRKQQNAYNMKKTIVFCEADEITDLADELFQNGVETITVDASMTSEDTAAAISNWNHLTLGRYQVLLCTDGLSKYLARIRSTDCLIHYCLPNKWSHFVGRFQPLLGNILSPLEGVEERNKCYLIVDEMSNQQSPIVEQYLNSLTRVCR